MDCNTVAVVVVFQMSSLSVPYSSGNGLQLSVLAGLAVLDILFQSPIHRGMDCNKLSIRLARSSGQSFSPLFIGEWIVTCFVRPHRDFFEFFQSPIHRGMDCNSNDPSHIGGAFSPLFIGEWIVTQTDTVRPRPTCFQSPIHRGMDCNLLEAAEQGRIKYFQSPIHRGMDCNAPMADKTLTMLCFQSPIHRGMDCNFC